LIQKAFDGKSNEYQKTSGSFKITRPVDPSNIKWKNMQIKKCERSIRGLLVALTLFALLYLSFLVQVEVSDWRFENIIFEKIDCGVYKEQNNKNIF
jgi:hypothetical protein